MKKLGAIILSFSFLGVCCITPSSEAVRIRVSQESSAGAGDFDANVLGFVDPFMTSLTTAPFYQYGVPNRASYNGELNGGPSPVSSLSQVFFVDAADGLSLVVVHDNTNDGSDGSTQMRWKLSGDTAAQLQADDPDEPLVVSMGGTQFDSTNNWGPCCTDGYAIGSLDGVWAMFGQFLALPTGIDDWTAISSDGGSISLELDVGRRVRFDVGQPVSVDIKPGSCPNPLKVKRKGVLPVAILGTEKFDVYTINPASVRLTLNVNGDGVPALRWAYKDVATPFEGDLCDCHDYNGDGYQDLTLKFDSPELVEMLGLDSYSGDIALTVKGNLYEEFGGAPIIGQDCIRVK